MKYIVIALAILTTALACSNPAAPKDCVSAAREAGAPEIVLDFLNNPTGDLNQAEKWAIRQFLNRTELNDLCGDALDELDRAALPTDPGDVTDDAWPNVFKRVMGQDNAQEAAALPTSVMHNTTEGGNRETFARCLNDLTEEISLLPWSYEVRNEETGRSWRLGDYSNNPETEMFKILRCLPFAPVATSRDGINRCVIDQVTYMRDQYPGADVQESALTFAMAICIPHFEQ